MARHCSVVSDWILAEDKRAMGIRDAPCKSGLHSAGDRDLWVVDAESAPEEWIEEQKRLAAMCVSEDSMGDWSIGKSGKIEGLQRVAGVDVSFFPDGEHAVVAVAVLSFPELELIHERCVTMRLTMPYVPGFLAFREAPACAALLVSLPEHVRPQAVLVDGNGAFHPFRCGCATHLGVSTGLPTVGVAKTVLEVGDVTVEKVRRIARTLKRPGHWTPLTVHKEPLAAVLWPCWEAKDPLVVSVGNLLSLRSAAILTAAVCREDVAEPVRQADLLGRAAVKRWLAGEPLADMRILGARAQRKGVESSVLPVIRNLLAVQAAKELGEDWKPVESKRQRRQRCSATRDGLLSVPGVARVSLPSDQAQRHRPRKSVALLHPNRKSKYEAAVLVNETSVDTQVVLAVDDVDAFPDLSQLRSGTSNSSAIRHVQHTSWPFKPQTSSKITFAAHVPLSQKDVSDDESTNAPSPASSD